LTIGGPCEIPFTQDSRHYHPVPYLPLFILPFKFFSLLNLSLSYVLWTLINCIGFILYLRFFTKKVIGFPVTFRLIFIVFLSLPFFLNLYYGQVNIWLAICAGEFIRHSLSHNTYLAGLWLGGWILKPQLLILLLPFLILQRSIKILMGFSTSTIGIIFTSLYLTDIEGFLALKDMLLEYSRGVPTNNIWAMMNWRMLGWHVAHITSKNTGWVIAIIGSLITACIPLYFFRKRIKSDSTQMIIILLGLFAATNVVAWHAHIHMSIILIPPLLYLNLKNRLNKNLLSAWIFIPVFIDFICYVLATFIILIFGNLHAGVYLATDFLLGFSQLILNLAILGWSIFQFTRPKEKLSDII